IVGSGAIDGRGGAVMTGGSNKGKWTWWDLDMASSIDGKNQQSPRILQVSSSKNFTMYNVTILNGPHFHVATSEVVGFKVYGIKLITPSLGYSVAGYACASGTSPSKTTVATKPSTCFTPDTVKNTDGFDPANSQYVVITQSYISDGDDNVAVKAGAVTSTSSVSTNHMYANNHFYYGHGMSIGSETDAGAHDISVTNLVFDGQGTALSGLRIKSDNTRGGEVYNVTYDGVCMKNIKNPLFFTTQYTTDSGSKLPNFHDITMRNVHYSGSGTLQFVGSSTHPLNRFTFDNVVFDTKLAITQSDVTNTIYGPGAVVNVPLSGAPTISGSGIDCSNAYIPMSTAFSGYYK
ncbi:MAG TPA: glycosyl hydrolase family 28 protein, partial [Rhodocyclaceae bacterium]|nr:glycosyl hydrolase family 28 protein [Rhodocyclaceae bacterium]